MSEHITKTNKYILDTYYKSSTSYTGRILVLNTFPSIELTKPEVLRLIGYLMDWVNRT